LLTKAGDSAINRGPASRRRWKRLGFLEEAPAASRERPRREGDHAQNEDPKDRGEAVQAERHRPRASPQVRRQPRDDQQEPQAPAPPAQQRHGPEGAPAEDPPPPPHRLIGERPCPAPNVVSKLAAVATAS